MPSCSQRHIVRISYSQAGQHLISAQCSRSLEVQSSPKLKSLHSEHAFAPLHALSAVANASKSSQVEERAGASKRKRVSGSDTIHKAPDPSKKIPSGWDAKSTLRLSRTLPCKSILFTVLPSRVSTNLLPVPSLLSSQGPQTHLLRRNNKTCFTNRAAVLDIQSQFSRL